MNSPLVAGSKKCSDWKLFLLPRHLIFTSGHLYFEITQSSIKIDLIGYLKTVGFGRKISKQISEQNGHIYFRFENTKFYEVAMAISIEYKLGWESTLANMDPLVGVWCPLIFWYSSMIIVDRLYCLFIAFRCNMILLLLLKEHNHITIKLILILLYHR